MKEIFVIGDIHGCMTKFNELLQYWDPDHQQLVILGDLIDRGKDSLPVILKCMELKEELGAIIIGGNHDEMFLNWLENPNQQATYYYKQGGQETIRSFFNGQDYASTLLPETIANLIHEQFQHVVNFLKELPDYYEQGNYVFVHAGVDLECSNWKDTSKSDFRWIRKPFHVAENKTGKIFVFGHTPTYKLNPDKSCNPWISSCQTKFGIDGGAVFGGLLLGLLIKEDCYEVYAA
jgi:serine/threonine protein phosphatase 1